MNKNSLLSATALRSVTVFGLALASVQPAFAQETQEEKQAESPPETLTSEQEAESGQDAESAADSDAIVVTGSRIRRPNLDSPLPVTSIGGQEFFETGNVSVGDTLNDLPALRSTFSQANSTRFLGTSGLNLLDLRGLSTVRTLVLQNGRRHVGGDVLSSGVSVDVNTIPTDLIERVDVVTGGNSAVYGSDAIAGVVNFILKDDYEGLQIRGQGGVSKYGDAGAYFVSGLWGTNFADGRGNIAVNAEYARQQQYFAADRPTIGRQNGFLVVDSDDPGDPNGSDGTPDRLFFKDIRSGSLTNTGAVRFGGSTAANSCGTDPLGSFYPCFFTFQPDGTLVPVTGTRAGVTTGAFLGGNSESFRGGDQIQLSPKLDRYNINVLGHFDVSEGFTPFFEAKYSRTDSSGTGNSGPAFVQGATLSDPNQLIFGLGNREQFRLDNPFLDPQARALICEQRALSGQGCADSSRVSIRENLLGLGERTEKATRETFRIVGGARGEFWDDWSYEISANYAKMKEETELLGTLDRQRWLLGMDAVDEGLASGGAANGNIVCRSQLQDPDDVIGYYPWIYGVAFPGGIVAGDPNGAARLAADVAACVPVNPFGGQFSQEVRDYVLRNTVAKGETSQLNFLGFVSGDTSSFLNLPGGPIGFVVGAEYRADDIFYDQDDDVSLGYTFYNAINTFEAPKSKVKEAFGEIRLPIVKDVTFLQELEVSAAARVSDYSIGTTGTVWAWNGSAVWSPVRGLRLRGNVGKSVRAPNQVELFFPFSQNFATVADPCSSINIGAGSANRAANCAAAGRPGGTDATINPTNGTEPAPVPGPYDFRYSSSLEIQSGGNPLLEAETSKSKTFGFVTTPSFLPGFSASVDHYNIKVDQVITGVLAQTIINSCYDLGAGNSFCDLFQRAGPGGAPSGEQEFRIIEGSLIQGPVNFAKLVAKGIDVELAYRGNIGNLGRLDTRLTYTHVLDSSQYLDPTDPGRQDVIVGKHGGEIGDPEDAFNWNTSLQHGRFTFGYQMRYLSKMYINTYEDTNSVQGRDPENADWADRKFYPSVFYHDIRLGMDVGPKYNFYLGIDNLTNTKPPLGATGIGGFTGIYENRGRFMYAGAVAKF